MTDNTTPRPWNSVHDINGIKYIFDHEQVSVSSVSNNGGFAQFNLSSIFPVGTPAVGDKLLVESGSNYLGTHEITEIVSTTQFVTDTAFSDSYVDGGVIKHIRTPEVKLYAGYLSGEGYSTEHPMTLLATFTPENDPNNQVSFYVHGFLKSLFTSIDPPGTDTGVELQLFNRFRLYFDGNYHDHFQVINSAIDTETLMDEFVNTGKYLNTDSPPPEFSCGVTILTRILNDIVWIDVITDGSPECDFDFSGTDFGTGTGDFATC